MAGQYEVPFVVHGDSGKASTTAVMTVINANGAPVFDNLAGWRIFESQPLSISAFAYDPDNPGFETPIRNPETDELIPRTAFEPTVTYTVDGLPAGAEFLTPTPRCSIGSPILNRRALIR